MVRTGSREEAFEKGAIAVFDPVFKLMHRAFNFIVELVNFEILGIIIASLFVLALAGGLLLILFYIYMDFFPPPEEDNTITPPEILSTIPPKEKPKPLLP